MRWKAKVWDKVGDTRDARRFAFWPTRVDGDDTPKIVWLEHYWDYQEYMAWGYGWKWVSLAKYSDGLPF